MTEESMHWADQTARRIIKEKGDKSKYTVAAGITPSGTVHIGNFREMITVDLVHRALKDAGKNVRFISLGMTTTFLGKYLKICQSKSY